MSDHARGCEGRNYTCTCGHDATSTALVERLTKALEPFADIADRDIGEDEADSDIFTPMSKYNRAPRPTVGMFRAARAALASAQSSRESAE